MADASAITERLRVHSYPAPHYLIWGSALGGAYAIQTTYASAC
jgi:hypothetical protein